VCSATCRAVRDRKLARARRRRDRGDVRAGERDRQRASRDRRAAASGCHAPPSASKLLLSQEEMGEIVDRALARSRATLTRDLRGALRRYGTKAGDAASAVTPVPRLASAYRDEGFGADRGSAVTHEPGPGSPGGA
jgi:hypothetical protein